MPLRLWLRMLAVASDMSAKRISLSSRDTNAGERPQLSLALQPERRRGCRGVHLGDAPDGGCAFVPRRTATVCLGLLSGQGLAPVGRTTVRTRTARLPHWSGQ